MFSLRISAMVLLSTALFGCASTWTPEQISGATNDHLCGAHAAKLNTGDHVNARPILDELVRRGLVREEMREKVASESVVMGMTPWEVRCGYGYPSEINRTATRFGSSEQWVYETYYGQTLGSTFEFIYFDDGLVSGWQD